MLSHRVSVKGHAGRSPDHFDSKSSLSLEHRPFEIYFCGLGGAAHPAAHLGCYFQLMARRSNFAVGAAIIAVCLRSGPNKRANDCFGSLAGVRVRVPDPLRFAIHKVNIAGRCVAQSQKKPKNIAQAHAIVAVYRAHDREALDDTFAVARRRSPVWRGAVK